jgi:hypothetical protein
LGLEQKVTIGNRAPSSYPRFFAALRSTQNTKGESRSE